MRCVGIEWEVKRKFSLWFLFSADNFIKKAKEIEENYSTEEDISNNIKNEYRSYVVSSIISTYTFLESNINEFYIDICDKQYKNNLDSNAQNKIENWWNDSNKHSTLCKYQKALKFLKKECFDKGREPYQQVKDLKKLRNELIHYKTGFVSTKNNVDASSHILKKVLKNKITKKQYNPFAKPGRPFFPDKCLSVSCSVWGLKSIINFTDEFYSKINVHPPYRKKETYINIINKYVTKNQ